MSTWSEWILLADYENEFSDHIDDHGPACYELGLAEEGEDDVDPVYIGETKNLFNRASSYAIDGSHLYEIIDGHLKDGFELYIRFQLFKTKEYAKEYQDRMLDKWDYDWNIQRNISDEEE